MRNLLSEIRDIADPALPIDQAGHRVALALGCCDDWISMMVGDVVEAKRNTMARQNVPDRNAEEGQGNRIRVSRGEIYDESEVKSQAPNICLGSCGSSWRTISASLMRLFDSPAIRISHYH